MCHRVIEEWMGEQVETLEDLLRPGLRAICVGINPAPRSVKAGHYYQGRLGQQFYARLRLVGLLPDQPGWEDDLAFESGIGFTDIVKRSTTRATEIRPEEFTYGREALRTKVDTVRPSLVILTFKKTAEILFGRSAGSGLVPGRDLRGSLPFVMPGPYAPRPEVEVRLSELASLAAAE